MFCIYSTDTISRGELPHSHKGVSAYRPDVHTFILEGYYFQLNFRDGILLQTKLSGQSSLKPSAKGVETRGGNNE